MRNVQHSFDQRQSAAAIFRAGLPDQTRGRVLTAASDIDSWRRKNFVIRERLRLERRAGVRS
jgi:predicted transcriptional regulator